MKKVHITSLGCAKNLVDSEVLTGQLNQRYYQITDVPEEADLVIVNTCGFIADAKNESIQAIFEAVNLKKQDKNKKVFVTGCLSQRYKNELYSEIPEIDGIFGTEDYKNILSALVEDHYDPEDLYLNRVLSTPAHYAYIKISEGCNHNCAFCTIPAIRGKYRSRSVEDILSESKMLAEKGVRELLLVSQDTSYYGKDRYGNQKIIYLLEEIARTDLFDWIRPMYWYPSNFPMHFIKLINKYNAIVPYLDMPIQHASDHVLISMNRAERNKSLRKLYQKIREDRPDICLRTTLILGHPDETSDDFKILLEFIEEMRFDRLGSFVYSDEEGTQSFNSKAKVPWELALRRQEEIMAIQQTISREKNDKIVNSIQKVLIDEYDDSQKCYVGRTYRDAPEIDNEVIINDLKFKPEIIGTFQDVEIYSATEYELCGKLSVS